MTFITTRQRVPFGWVDVFTHRTLAGNPLPVVFEADDLSTETMRSIAREFNQSETTFLMRPASTAADWQLRSFTPSGDEVLGAGHNAMGAWIWLAASGRLAPDRDAFIQQIGDELLDVSVLSRGDGMATVSITQTAPKFFGAIAMGGEYGSAELSEAIGLSASHFTGHAEVVSTGVAHLLARVATPAAVDAADPSSRLLRGFLSAIGAEGCYIYCISEDEHSHAYARFFNPTVGIVEDPATGTAAGPLAAILVRDGAVEAGEMIHIEQGTKMGRRSLIDIRIDGDIVRISGNGTITAEGALAL